MVTGSEKQIKKTVSIKTVPALWQHGVECAIKEGAKMKKNY